MRRFELLVVTIFVGALAFAATALAQEAGRTVLPQPENNSSWPGEERDRAMIEPPPPHSTMDGVAVQTYKR
jgi:hypothetical protein